jgi:hypothetical protein
MNFSKEPEDCCAFDLERSDPVRATARAGSVGIEGRLVKH